MHNITIVDSNNNEVIAVISKDEVIIKDGYEVIGKCRCRRRSRNKNDIQ